MFWIPSNKPLDLEWLETAPRQLEQQITTLPWGSSVSELVAKAWYGVYLFLPFLLVVIGAAVETSLPLQQIEQHPSGHRSLQA